MKVRDVLKMLLQDGWYLKRQRGSHRQLGHAVKKGNVTVAAGHPADELPSGTLKSILRQAELKK